MRVLYVMASVLSFLLYRIIGYRKKVIRDNLKNSFPGIDERTLKSYVREFYKRFCEYAVETLHLVSMDMEDIRKHCQIEVDPEIAELFSRQKPVLILTSHVFNWEWTLHAIRLATRQKGIAVYQRLTNEKFQHFMLELRKMTDADEMVEKSQVMRYMAQHRNDPCMTILLADQSPMGHTRKYWTDFMNQDTAFFLGPDLISYLWQMPVCFHRVRRIKRGEYLVSLEYLSPAPSAKGSDSIIEMYVRRLEETIQQDPPGYLWSHRRWKLKRD